MNTTTTNIDALENQWLAAQRKASRLLDIAETAESDAFYARHEAHLDDIEYTEAQIVALEAAAAEAAQVAEAEEGRLERLHDELTRA